MVYWAKVKENPVNGVQ